MKADNKVDVKIEPATMPDESEKSDSVSIGSYDPKNNCSVAEMLQPTMSFNEFELSPSFAKYLKKFSKKSKKRQIEDSLRRCQQKIKNYLGDDVDNRNKRIELNKQIEKHKQLLMQFPEDVEDE